MEDAGECARRGRGSDWHLPCTGEGEVLCPKMIVTCPACSRKTAIVARSRDVVCDCGRRFDPCARATVADPFLGRTFHGYRIEAVLGTGGMGTVYKALQLSLGRPVAVKVLPPNVADDPQFVVRFHREAEILAALSHRSIVSVIDRGEAEGRYYIVMEYVGGTSLRDLMRSGPVPPQEAYRIVSALLEALDYAHARGVIHRDVKPENVLVSHGGAVKVADFGVSRVLDAGALASRLTRTRLILGTYEYMSPEQREAAREADARSDIYAAAVVLFEMLTGELPIGRFDLPGRRLAAADRRIDAILNRGLAKDPQQRYARAGAMARDVCGLLSAPGRPVDLDAVSRAAESAAECGPAGAKGAVARTRPERPERREPRSPTSFELQLDLLLTFVAVAGALLVAAGVGLLVSNDGLELGLVDLDRGAAGLLTAAFGALAWAAVARARRYEPGGPTLLLALTALAAPTLVGLPVMAWTWLVLLAPSMRIYYDARHRGFDTFEAARLAQRLPLDPAPRPAVERRRRAAVTANRRAAAIAGVAALVAAVIWVAILAGSSRLAFGDEGIVALVTLLGLGPAAAWFALLGERVRHGEWTRLNARLWTLLGPLAPRAAHRARLLARDARDGLA